MNERLYGGDFLNVEKHMKKFPSNFDIIDLTACAEMARYLLPNMQLRRGVSKVDLSRT
jgi:hypothetical protein